MPVNWSANSAAEISCIGNKGFERSSGCKRTAAAAWLLYCAIGTGRNLQMNGLKVPEISEGESLRPKQHPYEWQPSREKVSNKGRVIPSAAIMSSGRSIESRDKRMPTPAPKMPPCSQNPGRQIASTGSETSFVKPSSKIRDSNLAPRTEQRRMQPIAAATSEDW